MEDNITLNIISTNQRTYQSKDQRENATNKKEERRKRLKKHKIKDNSDEESQAEVTARDKKEEDTPSVSKQAKAAKAANSSSSTPHKIHHKDKTRPVISSLFRNNPDIPKVESDTVEPIKETVFSEDSFESLDLHPFMIANLKDGLGLSTMTSVQKQSIPTILKGQDTMLKSQTGSGKTLAYAVPVIQSLQAISPRITRSDGTFAIIVVPTRELAVQSFEIFQKLVKPFVWIVPGCVMGGEKMKSEKARVRKGISVLVCTPGRLLDHIRNTASLNVTCLRWLIIDEADRLLDMGFEKDVSLIVKELDEKQDGSNRRQTVLLSATLTSGVEKLAGICLENPARIDVIHQKNKGTNIPKVKAKDDLETFSMPENLQHYFTVTPSKLRLVTLTAFILWKCKFAAKGGSKMIVFFSTQDSVEFHSKIFQEVLSMDDDDNDSDDINFFSLHGNMEQKVRTEVFHEFSKSKSGVLLCTDVAARGLDLPHVNWIVQYNPASSPTDYIHRVGRTARAGTRGQAMLFLSTTEVDYVQILNKNKIHLQETPMNDILKTVLVYYQNQGKEAPHTIEESASRLQRTFETTISENRMLHNIARKGYMSYIRAYSTYPTSMKHIFHIKKLHLGHAAKSFGLNEAPAKIGGATVHRKKVSKPRIKDFDRDQSGASKKRKVDLSEYGSGFDSNTAPPLKKAKNTKQKKKPSQKLQKKRKFK